MYSLRFILTWIVFQRKFDFFNALRFSFIGETIRELQEESIGCCIYIFELGESDARN
jgi:hypothetical protein